MKKHFAYIAAAVSVICCGIMAVVDGIWQPGYWTKSVIKICLFGLFPLLIAGIVQNMDIRSLFRLQKRGVFQALLIGVFLYVLIVGGYFLLRPFVDFSGIAGNLTKSAGVNKGNFLLVSLYISFVNSLLEEFFFRGFLLKGLKTGLSPAAACVFSAVLFAMYHTAMMISWFPLWLFLLVLAGLAVGGVLFSHLNKKQGTVYTSWFVHMFANFAINTIGFILL